MDGYELGKPRGITSDGEASWYVCRHRRKNRETFPSMSMMPVEQTKQKKMYEVYSRNNVKQRNRMQEMCS